MKSIKLSVLVKKGMVVVYRAKILQTFDFFGHLLDIVRSSEVRYELCLDVFVLSFVKTSIKSTRAGSGSGGEHFSRGFSLTVHSATRRRITAFTRAQMNVNNMQLQFSSETIFDH